MHVDVDLYEPTDEVLRYFMPRMSPGGAIVSDDYSWRARPQGRRSADGVAVLRDGIANPTLRPGEVS